MQFKYFLGPPAEMASLGEGEAACDLCGVAGPCFALEFAHCPAVPKDHRKGARGCFDCLRKGRFQFWHDTEMGLLDERGLSQFYKHNAPPPPDFPRAALTELRRTPRIVTWQQELWLCHCNDFMAYLGTWEPGDFTANAADGDGRSLFLQMTGPDLSHLWDESLRPGERRPASWHATYYAFRCLHCGRLRGNWDCA